MAGPIPRAPRTSTPRGVNRTVTFRMRNEQFISISRGSGARSQRARTTDPGLGSAHRRLPAHIISDGFKRIWRPVGLCFCFEYDVESHEKIIEKER